MDAQNTLDGDAEHEFENLIYKVALYEGFQNFRTEKCSGSLMGDGYLGIITAVRIVSNDKTDEEKVLEVVIKSAPKSEALRKKIPIRMTFNREIYMYSTVFPTLKQFEIKMGLTSTCFSPKYYQSCSENTKETLVLENLKESGYRLYERSLPMDENHVNLVFTQYGRFHALSFALREKNLAEFRNLTAEMNDVYLNSNSRADFIDMFETQCKKVKEVLDPVEDKKPLKVYESFLEKFQSSFTEVLKALDEYSVVLHGDCWTNNMMFKYCDTNNEFKPTDIRFIDFQLSKLGSPVTDLSYFFYACCSKEIINNLDHYLNIYYKSLSSTLVEFGLDPSKLFPYSVLRQHWKAYARFGLVLAIAVIRIMLTEKEETVDLTNISELGISIEDAFLYNFAKIDVYNDRIRHIILHFVQNDFLWY